MLMIQSAPPDEFRSVQPGIQTCTDDVLSCMNNNKLMLNIDRVTAVVTSSCLRLVDSDLADIRGSNILFKTSVKYLYQS